MADEIIESEKERTVLALIIARSWKDESYKKRFISEPSVVLKEEGVSVPEGIDLKVIEDGRELQSALNVGKTQYIILPTVPEDVNVDESSLDDLVLVSRRTNETTSF